MNNRQAIHIALAFDKRFITPFYTFATSLIHHNANDVTIHVIATIHIEEKNMMLKYMGERGAKIIFYDIDVALFDKFSIPSGTHYSSAIFYRLLFPSLVQDTVSTLLYLDVDTLICGNLNSLFENEDTDFVVRCVRDNLDEIRSDLGLSHSADYFNSGVLLINVPLWIKERVTEKCIEYIQKKGDKLIYPDQDALNVVLKGKWGCLDRRYNFMLSNEEMSMDLESLKIEPEPIIIHYNGTLKPWTMLCSHHLKPLYHKHLKMFIQSPIGEQRIFNSFEKFFPLLPDEDIRDPQTAMFYAFVMHLLWIKALKTTLNETLFQSIFSNTYSGLGQLPSQARLAVEQHANLIKAARAEIAVQNKSQLLSDTSWTEQWFSDCVERIQLIQGLSHDEAAFKTVPDLINDRLSITNALQGMLEYAINEVE